jgi:hypothetical protein
MILAIKSFGFCQRIDTLAHYGTHLRFQPSLIYTKENHFTARPNIFLQIENQSLPFFCKLEEDWTKSAGLNVRFRLGSLEYVDYLEGKNTNIGLNSFIHRTQPR